MNNFDVVDLFETLWNNFDKTYFDSFDVYTGKDENKLKGFHGMALMVTKTLQQKFVESGSGLWVEITNANLCYDIGLFYMPCETSKFWHQELFDSIEEEVTQHRYANENVIILGDFNAGTGLLPDFVSIDEDDWQFQSRANADKKVNNNGRRLVDLCKICDMLIINGRVGSDNNIGNYTCTTYNGKSTVDYAVADAKTITKIYSFDILGFDPSLSDVHMPITMTVEFRIKTVEEVREHLPRTKVRKWNENIMIKYQEKLSIRLASSGFVPEIDHETDLNSFNEKLKQSLTEIATEAGALRMEKKHMRRRNAWFDKECENARLEYRRATRHTQLTHLKRVAL